MKLPVGPARWAPGPHFKKPISGQVVRRVKKAKADTEVERHMRAVRRRDKRCRFPLCGCGKLKLTLHVSHQTHRGMGGNPKGDRSTPERMVLLCGPRHRENATSVDRGTARWRMLTADGANGPIAWDITLKGGQWFEVAREIEPGTLDVLTARQRGILEALGEMKS